MSSISLNIDKEAAYIFNNYSSEKKELLTSFVESLLKQNIKSTTEEHISSILNASRIAKQKGLTEELLMEIVDE